MHIEGYLTVESRRLSEISEKHSCPIVKDCVLTQNYWVFGLFPLSGIP
jgi:hypothetical protein